MAGMLNIIEKKKATSYTLKKNPILIINHFQVIYRISVNILT